LGGLGFLLNQNIESYANQMTIDIAKLPAIEKLSGTSQSARF
jgi:hypothetical protein